MGYAVLPPIQPSETGEQLPLAYLVGGPGPSTTAQAHEFATGKPLAFMRHSREVILMDYRGVGSSEPALECEFPSDSAGGSTCGAVVTQSTLDFADMRSTVFAQDLDQLLAALGHEQAFVYGGSYGTRLALTVMRDAPDRVSAVVLDGVFPIEVNGFSQGEVAPLAGLNAIVGRCSDSATCTQELGNTRAQIELLISNWSSAAIELPLQQAALGQLGKLAYHPAAPLLVKLLSEAPAANSIGALQQFEERLFYIDGAPFEEFADEPNIPPSLVSQVESNPMALSIICSEEAPFTATQPIDAAVGFPFGFSDSVVSVLRGFQGGAPIDVPTASAVCGGFGAPAASAIEAQAVISSIPTLILNGGMDSQTSFAWGDQVAVDLINSTAVLIPLSEHITAGSSECAQSLMTSFLANPEHALDTRCADDLILPIITESDNVVAEIICNPQNAAANCE